MSEKELKRHLNNFSCKKNNDVEHFLKNTAIRFEQADKARTYLIVPKNDYLNEDKTLKIFGYFALSTKTMKIPNTLSKSRVRALDGLDKNAKEIDAYLIGQLAKNDQFKNEIDGEYILENAVNALKQCHQLIGRRVVLIECENKPSLIKFYEDNHFQLIGQDEDTNLLQYALTITNNTTEEANSILEKLRNAE